MSRLKAGTWLKEIGGATVCLDLPRGKTELNV
jgi:hypothetical protein